MSTFEFTIAIGLRTPGGTTLKTVERLVQYKDLAERCGLDTFPAGTKATFPLIIEIGGVNHLVPVELPLDASGAKVSIGLKLDPVETTELAFERDEQGRAIAIRGGKYTAEQRLTPVLDSVEE